MFQIPKHTEELKNSRLQKVRSNWINSETEQYGG